VRGRPEPRPHLGGLLLLAFVLDVYSRRIVGWCAAIHLRTELRLAALDKAAALRDERLVHHSDRGSQLHLHPLQRAPPAVRITPSVGSRGDSYDNALAESVIGLYKTELIAGRSWGTPTQVERETAAYVHWSNHRRLHGACGDTRRRSMRPAYYRNRETSASAENR
jgi:putative transposase